MPSPRHYPSPLLAAPASQSCQTNTPGGLFLQTQFWDYNPATGPSNSWTIHGLWPDNCDGSYVSNCDSSRNENDIGSVLQSRGATSTLDYMNDYWCVAFVDAGGMMATDNASFSGSTSTATTHSSGRTSGTRTAPASPPLSPNATRPTSLARTLSTFSPPR